MGETSKPLRALLVEDDSDDAALVIRELRRGGYNPITERVQTESELTAALTDKSWDIVLSDYSLPTLDAPTAFAVVRNLNLDVPFIIISGTVGEEVAVAAMRTGVHDFLLKGHLGRLVAAIERELREAAMRSERRRIQEQLLISDRMASVGTLAAGVAHEINNPLSVVTGNLELALQELDALQGELGRTANGAHRALSSLRGAARDAKEAAERVRTIVRDLRVFSRPEEERREPVDVHKVLESSIRMAHNELRHRAQVERRFGSVPCVDGNEARLGQVFLNLLVNAAHAIPEGNTDQNRIVIETRAEGGMVLVDVIDTGQGIAPEILPRIFDVFFTTKPIGVGTGLGLSICHRILTAMNGQIDIKSQRGEGTRVRVSLRPAEGGQAAVAPATTPAPLPRTGRKADILVIEDELALGRVLLRLLTPHRVTLATRGREALERIAEGHDYAVVLCDLMMPEMTGMDFYAALVQTRPELASRVVFMTGGAFTPGARDFLETVPNRRIDKPIDVARLRRLIQEMLEGSAAKAS